MALSRRSFLSLSLLSLSGCAGTIFGRAEEPGPGFRVGAASRLRIAIFEVEPLSLPFHTGMMIHAPEGHVLYDPAGYWHDERAPRINDLTYGMTPELEEAYIRRSSMGPTKGLWSVHLFEAEVAPEVATRAIEIARDRNPVIFGACALGLSTLLAELPGFEDIRPTLVPETLLSQLRTRNDLVYSHRPTTEMRQDA